MAESTPLQFEVPDMVQRSCVDSIKKAVCGVDPAAHVVADLNTKRVVIGSDGRADDFAEAIAHAGFTVKAAG